MVSREHMKRSEEALHDKLQLLRAITHSDAMTGASIVVDASNYIKELKQKVELMNHEITTAQSSGNHNRPCPQVSVQTLEKGFLVNVHSGKCCPGLLVSILETFEGLGLDVIEARASCANSFNLQAFFGGEGDEDEDNIDAQALKLVISNTIKNWSENS